MNVVFTFKNFDASEHLKEYANTRFSKLVKFVTNPDNTEMQVNLSVDKFRHVAEVVLSSDHIHISAYEESEDMYSTVDLVLDKLEVQLRRMREKMRSHRRKEVTSARMDVISFDEEDENREPVIVESDSFVPKPMSIDEAAMQLQTLDHEFLVFRNADNEAINVIYRRNNGDFGLIDPGY
ncbi:ribosome hibernation-promoting factor, HPF/YfiA family [Maridesulfovibrio hydrothermalis]|uniref:Ribosome hibernation promoting factor n=1 Tax=Maridesulfovibrio hydrothermalis AM13 = DSM 14728 TaxID=1121451 RepID=L0RBW8_9BACT|nr:ribosome-associated translation inhibitor RaiA [Maridesulfovibrio hydrothermalis]CCO24249.1 Sigma 54 modulation protein/ribosomal protein S30EA [Maridesulfovibrio hydrothermalis AM13 = DSM 14728]